MATILSCPVDYDNSVNLPQTNLAWVDTSSPTGVQACVTYFSQASGGCGSIVTGSNGQLSGSALNPWTQDDGLDYAYIYVSGPGTAIHGYGFNTTQ